MISTLSRQASPASDFYDAAERTRNAPQALADVGRDWLVNFAKTGLDAVRLAGAFIMSSQGSTNSLASKD